MTPRDPIKVDELAGAPERFRWKATFGDWDFGDPFGIGATPEAAIEDLYWDAEE